MPEMMKWILHRYYVDIIFMNSKKCKTSEPHRLLLNLSEERDLKRSGKYVPLSNLSIYYPWINIKK